MTKSTHSLIKINLSIIGLFLLGLSSAIRFQLAGQLFLTDILVAITFVILVVPRWRQLPWKHLGPIMVLMLFWLVGQGVTDLIRSTSIDNIERGWLKILSFGATLLVVAALSEMRMERIMAFSVGLALAHMIDAVISPDVYEVGQPWKFGFGMPLATLSVVVASLGRVKQLAWRVLPPLAVGVASLGLGYRSLFGILGATVGVTLIIHIASRMWRNRRIASSPIIIVIIAIAISGAWAVGALYSGLAGAGYLGRYEQAKFETENEGTAGLLFSARSDTFTAFKAIADSPLLGHGSWAADRAYRMYEVLMLRQYGVNVSEGAYTADLIPSHSYLFGAWVEAGLAGALYWAFVLWITGRAMVSLIDMRLVATPFLAFGFANLLWNILFSPFGAEVRFVVACQLCMVIWVALADKAARKPAMARLA